MTKTFATLDERGIEALQERDATLYLPGSYRENDLRYHLVLSDGQLCDAPGEIADETEVEDVTAVEPEDICKYCQNAWVMRQTIRATIRSGYDGTWGISSTEIGNELDISSSVAQKWAERLVGLGRVEKCTTLTESGPDVGYRPVEQDEHKHQQNAARTQ